MNSREVNGPHCRLVVKKSSMKRTVGKYTVAAILPVRRQQLEMRDIQDVAYLLYYFLFQFLLF